MPRPIYLYNTQTRQKELLQPLSPGRVGIYVCGITVYDFCHLGHGRVMTVFDALIRFLRSQGYVVDYVRNITDIDDKILQRAQETNVHWYELSARMSLHMQEDFELLGLIRPQHEPRATASIDQMIELIEKLFQQGLAYTTPKGDVCFSVSGFLDYGGLSHQDITALRSGARIEADAEKRDPLDFVLWKSSKPGEPFWSSPWGPGRPGWHIECSAMSSQYLGSTFDIHGGGIDLQFPHHENERAQSEGASGCPLAMIWMHVGFLNIRSEKMSKSLGNVLPLRQMIQDHSAEVLRFWILSCHYRQPLNYAEDSLEQAKQGLTRLYTALRGTEDIWFDELPMSDYRERFCEALATDLNTPEAIAVLFELARELNRMKSVHSEEASVLASELRALGRMIGLLQDQPEHYFQKNSGDLSDIDIERLIQERHEARARGDFKHSDRIRQQLQEKGIALEDGKDTTLWRREG